MTKSEARLYTPNEIELAEKHHYPLATVHAVCSRLDNIQARQILKDCRFWGEDPHQMLAYMLTNGYNRI